MCVLTPNAAAAELTPNIDVSWFMCTRPCTVNLAFLCMFIWSFLEVSVVWKHQFLRYDQVNNLLKHYIYGVRCMMKKWSAPIARG